MNQIALTEKEYSNRKKRIKREESLDDMEEIIPWAYWVDMTRPYYFNNKRGADLLESKPCCACISCRHGIICQMKESKILSMTAMQCARLCP